MPLARIKAGLAVATDDDDALLSGHIAAAVSLIEKETGVPLIDREFVLETCQPSADGALLLRFRDISAVASITYWPAGTTGSQLPPRRPRPSSGVSTRGRTGRSCTRRRPAGRTSSRGRRYGRR